MTGAPGAGRHGATDAATSPVIPRAPAHGWIPKAAKIILPLVAIGVVALVFVWSKVNLEVIRLQISETEVAPEDIDAISMTNARFAGSDERNRRFVVTAEEASQAIGEENSIDLRRIEASIILASGDTVVIDADTGVYRRDEKRLSLAGGVSVSHDRGFVLNTARADIDLRDKTASGDAAVTGAGPDGELWAEGFRVVDDGNLIELIGRSRVLFKPGDDEAVP